MKQCKCGSFAINHTCHGRNGSDGDLCDVCYWRKRANEPIDFITFSDMFGDREGYRDIWDSLVQEGHIRVE